VFEQWDAPSASEIEISIFGRGSGEAIVAHLGDGKWLVIDSLRVDGEPIALTYLAELGVNVAHDLQLLLASHWHDDHIHGLADIYERAQAAAVSFPLAMAADEFRQFASQFTGVPPGRITSGVREYGRILEAMNNRGWVGVQFAKAWTTLVRHHAGTLSHGLAVDVEAISPSDFDVKEFMGFIAQQTVPAGTVATALRAPHYDRNDVSCAVQIRVGDHSVLLGADLEDVAHPNSGWKAVFAAPQLPGRTASLFKVSHHGSVTGDHPEIWTRLCLDNPIATLTPWARGDGRLPQPADVLRIRARAAQSYSAARTVTSGDRHRLVAVNSVLKRTQSRVRNIDLRLGHVRHRLDVAADVPSWSTTLIGAACELKDVAA
jgi:hypothetical protein